MPLDRAILESLIEVSPDIVVAQLARVKAAGLPVREEMDVNCCHANQDKFWVQDPDGVEWEVYHLNYDLEGELSVVSTEDGAKAVGSMSLPLTAAGSCCAPSCCAPR